MTRLTQLVTYYPDTKDLSIAQYQRMHEAIEEQQEALHKIQDLYVDLYCKLLALHKLEAEDIHSFDEVYEELFVYRNTVEDIFARIIADTPED